MDLLCFIAAVICAGALWLDLCGWQPQAAQDLTDADRLFLLARSTESSEFEQFKRAARHWNISDQKAESDFNHYLMHEQLPYYVRDYLRKAKKSDFTRRGPLV